MECLQVTRLLSWKSFLSTAKAGTHFRPTTQLGFPPLSQTITKNGCVMIKRSFTNGGTGSGCDAASGNISPQHVSSSIEDEDKPGFLLGQEKDSSDSVIGFHLIPPSGDHEVIDSHEDVASYGVKKIDIEGEEKAQTRVSYNIVFVTSEAAPYSKTGGLGDVCGSLPIALAARGHRVMVVSPRYLNGTAADKNFSLAKDLGCCIKIYCFGGEQEAAFFHEYKEGVDWVFVDHPSYHRPGNPYGDINGAFGDNQFRYALLCYAACEAPLVLPLGGFTYGEKCLFLVNDWHAGLVPVLLASKYRPYGVYIDARSILLIHNLSHQGVEPATTYKHLGLPPEWYGALEWVFPNWARAHALDTGEAVNVLKGAIVTADRLLTVSKGYSWEITTVEGGYGLHEILSSRKSVLNGMCFESITTTARAVLSCRVCLRWPGIKLKGPPRVTYFDGTNFY